MINFCQKHMPYGSNYVVFSNISRNFRSRYHTVLTILSFQELYISFNQELFFYFKYFLKPPIKSNTSYITHNYHFTKIRPILSKAHLAQPVLHFPKYIAKFDKKFNPRQYGLTQTVHLKKSMFL